MALIALDFHTVSGDWTCNLQYCDNNNLESRFLFPFTNAPDTESGLNSGFRMRPKISTSSLEISTGGEPWSISADMGVGAQVKGASMQQVHLRCSGKEKGWGMLMSHRQLWMHKTD